MAGVLSLLGAVSRPVFVAAVDADSTFASGGASWWQTLGGLLAVFGLLVLCLKFIGRLDRRQSRAEAQVLTIWSLGPRREIQVLRLGEEVHYIYRHENAMVRLKEESHSAWRASHGDEFPAPEPSRWQRFLPGGWQLPRRSTGTGNLTSF